MIDAEAYATLAREAKTRVAERAMMIAPMVTENGSLMDSHTYVCWDLGDDSARLDDSFSANTLTAIAEHMAARTDVPTLADAVLALVERVRELESNISEAAIDASAEHARVVAFLEHQASLRADDKSAWAALLVAAFAIKGREHGKCLKALDAALQIRVAAKEKPQLAVGPVMPEGIVERVARAICEERFVEAHEEAVASRRFPALNDPRDQERIDRSWPLFTRHAMAALNAISDALAEEQRAVEASK